MKPKTKKEMTAKDNTVKENNVTLSFWDGKSWVSIAEGLWGQNILNET